MCTAIAKLGRGVSLYAAAVASWQREAWPHRPHEILDPHTGLTVPSVGSNGAHIKGVASSLQLATSSAAIPLWYKSWF